MVAQYKERHLIKSESIGASFYVHIEVVVALKPQQFFGIIPDKQIDLLCAFTTMSFESVLIGKQVRLVILALSSSPIITSFLNVYLQRERESSPKIKNSDGKFHLRSRV